MENYHSYAEVVPWEEEDHLLERELSEIKFMHINCCLYENLCPLTIVLAVTL